jgi:hypothetical protein
MSERIRFSGEQDIKSYESLSEHEKGIKNHHETSAARAKHEHKEQLDKILEKVEREAISSKDTDIEKVSADSQPEFFTSYVSKAALQNNLARIQQKLSKPEKQFSRFVHNPRIDQISELAGQSVARPSGLLFGGLFAFLVSLAVLIACKYYGYEYNYLLGMAGFAGGFFLGITLELLYRLVPRR